MFIEKLSLKNFKSFRECDLRLVRGFNAVVGPNGSGKTNIVDAVLFALGESRIRSLRAKKAPDLIYKDARIAEAKLELRDENDGKHAWVSRALRRDGKMRYLLDGKHSHRYVIEDFLRSNHISSYNIIQQGAVQRIVEMSSKERRELIDNIANVLEYEQKKKEALSELDKVEEKIREDSAKLAEKAGFLEQLKKDKADAERFLTLKKEADSLKATLLYLNLHEHEIEFENAVNSVLDLGSKAEQLLRKANDLQAKIDEFQRSKDEVNRKINERSEGKQLVLEREVEDLKVEMERCRTLTQEKVSELERLAGRAKELALEKQRAGDEIKGVKARVADVERELKSLGQLLSDEQKKLDDMVKTNTQFSQGFFEARKEYERLQNEMLATKEQLGALQGEEKTIEEVSKLKENELQRLQEGRSDSSASRADALEEGMKDWKRKLKLEEDALQKLFDEEKALNGELVSMEKTITEAKVKTVEITTRLQNLREMELSQGVEYVLGQKKNEEGIYGTLEQLCSYDSGYAVPVQVALGGRLNFVVVSSFRVAEKMVQQLRQRKLGRVSFIPLDRIKSYSFTPEELKLKQHPAAVDFLVHLMQYDRTFEKAFSFACGNTLVVKSLKEAEPLVNRVRLVTGEGELVEQTGLVTGGSFAARFNLKKEKETLEEWDAKLRKAKEAREATLKRLYDVQEEMSGARKRKASVEVQLKASELQMQSLEKTAAEEEAKGRNVKAAVAALKKEMMEAKSRAEKIQEDRAGLIRRLSDLNIASLDAKGKIDVEKEQKFGLQLKEKEKRVSDLKFSFSDYQHRREALDTQLKAFEREHAGLSKSEEDLVAQEGEAKRVQKECKETLAKDQGLLKERLEQLKGLSSAMQELIEAREKLEGQVYKLANEKGKLEFEREKHVGELQKKEVAKAVAETNLTNLKAEYAPFQDVPLLKIEDKAHLVSLGRQADEEMARLGSVNLKAVEEYEDRAKDLDAQTEKVHQLSNEKQAVLTMIQEIEGKKIATFIRSFNHVNGSFQKLFGQIFNGTGSLVLENPSSPFEGGLTIKAQLEGKPVKYLELMSGGEKSLIAVLFLFAIQSYSPSSVYILDEADAALDELNSQKLAQLLKQLSKDTQFIVVSHNKSVYKNASALIGVTMTKNGSQLVEVKLDE